MKLRKHRHRFVASEPDGFVQVIACAIKRCGYAYEQFLLFDPRAFG